MKKLTVLFLLCSNLFVRAQTIDETINYINSQIIESTKSVKDLQRYFQLSISSDGKLIVDWYEIILGKIFLMKSSSCYIKQLTFSQMKEVAVPKQPDYYIGLKCINNSNCVTSQVGRRAVQYLDEMGFIVYNEDKAQKIKNAILHLIKISHANPNFREKDPFDY